MAYTNESVLRLMGKLVELRSFLEMSITPCDAMLSNKAHNLDDIQKELDDLCATIDKAHEDARRIHAKLIVRINAIGGGDGAGKR